MAANDRILTAGQMRAAEERLISAGETVASLMERAGIGAARWVRRMAGARTVTILCGPGNNGGDGYVIARELLAQGLAVTVVAPLPPATPAARAARAAYSGPMREGFAPDVGEGLSGVLVDCLFGSGLNRPLGDNLRGLLDGLAKRHAMRIAVDVPSGIDADDAGVFADAGVAAWQPPLFDLTLALGAWKFAHWQMPARLLSRAQRLVDIGIGEVAGAARAIGRPCVAAPAPDAHKYSRGLCAVIGGAMPGAALLASMAAMRGGAGYVKLLAQDDARSVDAPADLVMETGPVGDLLRRKRPDAVLIGPGLGRGADARARLADVLDADMPLVLDADALHLLTPGDMRAGQAIIATPHHGEMAALCGVFGVQAARHRDRALELARVSGMVIMAKGPDSVVAAPDGRLGCAPPGPSWLSVAGTGDVLAGLIASRLATGLPAFEAACESVWLHGAAARIVGGPFTASDLVRAIPAAIQECL